MFVLVRAATYSTLFIGLLLVFLPARVLAWSGVVRPAAFGPIELVGAMVSVGGAAMAIWSILTFVVVGRGTPAPFDPPRRLVVRGPYHFVRNPMYIGAVLALGGAAIVYRSLAPRLRAALWRQHAPVRGNVRGAHAVPPLRCRLPGLSVARASVVAGPVAEAPHSGTAGLSLRGH